MMKKRAGFCLAIFCLVSVLSAGCGKRDAWEVKDVYAEAYVSGNGRTLTKIVYCMKQDIDSAGLGKGDFQVTYSSGNGSDKNSLRVYQKKKVGIAQVETRKNMLILSLEETAVGEAKSLSVNCKKNALDAENISIRTRTADEFEKGEFVSKDGVRLTYWFYRPKDGGRHPLMVWEHGGGEILEDSYEGANLWENRGAVAWTEAGKETCVLSVQYQKNYSFEIADRPGELREMERIHTAKYELIRRLINEGIVDENRVYICGASSGGGAAIRFLMQYPDLFAAALILSAKDVLAPMSLRYQLAYQPQEERLTISSEEYEKCYHKSWAMLEGIDLRGVPIWLVHAKKDPICTSYTSEILYRILEEKGAEKNRLTLWSNKDLKEMGMRPLDPHTAYNLALENQEMIDWVYAQRKSR